jgi:hypothetical protein
MALANRFIALCKGKKVFDGSAIDAYKSDLESWGIRNPLRDNIQNPEDLLW